MTAPKKVLNHIVSQICKKEGKKHQATNPDVREILKIIIDDQIQKNEKKEFWDGMVAQLLILCDELAPEK